MVVVVQAGFGVVVLAGETQWAVEVTGGRWWAGAPQGAPGLPGEVAVGVDQFGGGTDEVGDNGVELGIEPRLLGPVVTSFATWNILGQAAFGLGERAEAAGFPVPGRDARRQTVGGGVVLFGEDDAVPGEVNLFDHGCIVVAEALFGDPAAERVIGIAPALTVRGAHPGQPVLAVPAVPPGPRPRRQPFLLA